MNTKALSILVCGVLACLLVSLRAFGQDLELEHRYAEVNGVRLHFVTAGSGKLILFLHGFPEFWYQWKPQLAEFSKDYRVVAPDMRGYNFSSKPSQVDQYQVKYLVEDVRALAEHLGHKKLILIGHDWGGAVAWAFALYHPSYVEKLVILNAPHPAIFDREMKENPAQQAASQYMLMLRSPEAEKILADKNYELLVNVVLAEGLKTGQFSEHDRNAYLEAWSQPGALTGGINYYRAARVGPPNAQAKLEAHANYTPDIASPVVRVPTLLIWGLKDPYLLAGNLSGIGKFVPDLTVKLLADASHSVNHEKPKEVNSFIREFIESKQ